MPAFNSESAGTAFDTILENLKQPGTIAIGNIIKDITVKTTSNQSRKVQESDFDRIAVLANIMKTIGEKGPKGFLAKVKRMNETDKPKFKALLEAVRNSEVFNNLTHSERRAINSAYRAVAFQEERVPVLSKITDFIKEVWRDFHTSEIPVTERREIEKILLDLIPEEGAKVEDSFTNTKLAILNEKAKTCFGIKNPSTQLEAFAQKVEEKIQVILAAAQEKAQQKGAAESDRQKKAQASRAEERQEKAQGRSEKPKRPKSTAAKEEPQTQPEEEKPEQPDEKAIDKFKDWFLHHMTGEQEDAICKLEKADPGYKEFCKVASWVVTSMYQEFESVIKDSSGGKLNRQQFVERCANISSKFNQYVSPSPTKDVKEEGRTVISLREWLTRRGVEDPLDPRWMFLNGFHELFQSFNRQIRAVMQEAYGQPETEHREEAAGAKRVETGEEFKEADPETVLRFNEALGRFELPSAIFEDDEGKFWRNISWFDPETKRSGQDRIQVPDPFAQEDIQEGAGRGQLVLRNPKGK